MVSPSGPPTSSSRQPQAHTDHLVTLADMHSTPQGHCGALRRRPWNGDFSGGPVKNLPCNEGDSRINPCLEVRSCMQQSVPERGREDKEERSAFSQARSLNRVHNIKLSGAREVVKKKCSKLGKRASGVVAQW